MKQPVTNVKEKEGISSAPETYISVQPMMLRDMELLCPCRLKQRLEEWLSQDPSSQASLAWLCVVMTAAGQSKIQRKTD